MCLLFGLRTVLMWQPLPDHASLPAAVFHANQASKQQVGAKAGGGGLPKDRIHGARVPHPQAQRQDRLQF
eukprot:7373553-Lingulodinium_polyedra.AAC.1